MAFFFCFLISFHNGWSASEKAKSFTVVIDPGHGGEDLGAVRDSFLEKDIVLQIALKVQEELQSQAPDITVWLTRNSDRSLALAERVDLITDKKADLMLSLHANSASSRLASGMEFYFSSPQKLLPISQNPSADTSGAKLTAADVIKKIKADFEQYEKTDRSLLLTKLIQEGLSSAEQKSVIRRAPFYVLEQAPVPAALVELGFITNRRDARLLTSEPYQQKLAELLTRTVIQYRDNLRKE